MFSSATCDLHSILINNLLLIAVSPLSICPWFSRQIWQNETKFDTEEAVLINTFGALPMVKQDTLQRVDSLKRELCYQPD